MTNEIVAAFGPVIVTSRTRAGWSKKAGPCMDNLEPGVIFSPRSSFDGSQRIHPLQISHSCGQGPGPRA